MARGSPSTSSYLRASPESQFRNSSTDIRAEILANTTIGHLYQNLVLPSQGHGVCAAGAAQVRTTGEIMVWKTPALCATVRQNQSEVCHEPARCRRHQHHAG